MIRINLLPVRQQRKAEAARRELSLIGALGVVVVLLSLGGWALTSQQLASRNDENAALQQEINQLQEQVKEVDAMEKAKTELERKLAVIGELRDKKSGPVHMMDELAIATPERVVLLTLKQKDADLEISGISVSNEIISQFLRSLDASTYFESVYLKNIEAMKGEATSGNSNVVLKKFELTARLVTPKPAGAEQKEGAATPDGANAGAGGAPPPTDAPPAAPGGGA